MHHSILDQRSLALHQLIAQKIEQEPLLFQKVGATLERWKQIVSQDSMPLVMKWDTLYQLGMDTCLKTATEKSDYADQLRQASPFCGILSPPERSLFFKKWKENQL